MKTKVTFLNNFLESVTREIEVRELTDKIVELSTKGFSIQSIYGMPEGAIMKSYIKHLHRLQNAEDANKCKLRAA